MAYSDIERWASMINEGIHEEEAWDKACAKRNAMADAMDEREFENLDVEPIDPATLGLTQDETEQIAEETAEQDEVIDFSVYGVCEADEFREPLTAVSKAFGAPASTANLTAQDSVKLAEAIEKLAKAVDKGGDKDEKEDSKKKDSKKEDEQPVDEADIDQSVDSNTLSKLNALADQLRDGSQEADAMTDADWKKIDDMPEETKDDLEKKINFINDKLNKGKIKSAQIKKRLFNLVTDYKEILKGYSDVEKEETDSQADFRRAQEIQRLSAKRELSQEEKEEFIDILGRLSDEQREDLYVSKPDLANLEFTLNPSDAYINKDSGRQKRTQLSQKAAGDDMDDTMASAYGVDSTFSVGDEKGDAWDAEYDIDPMIPSNQEGPRKYNMAIDPEKTVGLNRTRIDAQKAWNEFLKTKDNDELLNAWLSNPNKGPDDPEGKIPTEWHGGSGMTDDKIQAARDIVKAKKGGSLTPSEWVKVMNTVAKPVRDALRDEFKADAEARRAEAEAIQDQTKRDMALADIDAEKMFVDKLFNGQVTNLNQQEYGVERGYGTGGINQNKKRSLSTGGITQVKDKITNIILVVIAENLRVAEDLCERMRANLRAESTAARTIRKELRPAILREIFAELRMPEDRVPDPQIGLKEKRMFDQIVTTMLKRIWDESDQSERNDILEKIFAFHDATKVRKSKTYLDAKQNAKFQELKGMALDDDKRSMMDDSDAIELIALNDIRLHNTEPVQARQKAIEIIDRVKARDPENMYAVIEYIAREFARGDSQNHNLGRARETFRDGSTEGSEEA